jgi:nitroreductase
MEFKQVLGLRRSIRYFDPKESVPREKVQAILEAVNRSSRAINADFVKAIVVYTDELDAETVEALKVPTNTAEMDLAPVHIFFYLDTRYGEGAQARLKELVDLAVLNPSHGWSHAYVDDVVYATVLQPMLSDPGTAAFVGALEVGMAISSGLLTAVDEGLGACMHAFNTEVAKKVLDVPDHWIPCWEMSLGYPAEDRAAGGQRPRRPLASSFYDGRYGSPWQEIPSVTERLTQEGLIQPSAADPARLTQRREEVKELARRFGLPE